jgi:glucose/arabinose dehydrogenase
MNVLGLLLLGLLAFASPARANVPAPGFVDTLVVGGLTQPTAIAFLPDGTLLVTEKGGALKHVVGSTATTLVAIDVCTVFETGLLGIALDPGFTANGWVYLYRTQPLAGCGPHVNQVVRITIAPDGTVDPGSLVEILGGINSFLAHNGGVLRVGPDGKLWVGVGDSGTPARAQDVGLLEGKVLRVERDGTIPSDNPFVGQPGARPEVYAYGFRNPFRFDFDPVTGRLWVCDVGNMTMEEIDIVVAGGNHAWPRCEGTEPPGCALPGDVAPIFTYPHTGPTSLGNAILGGTFGGGALGPFAGQLFFADIVKTVIYRARPTFDRSGIVGVPVPIVTDAGLATDFVRGPDGAVYYVVYAGEVRRLATGAGADVPVRGSRLLARVGNTPERRRLTISSRDPALLLGAGEDPRVTGGELYVRGLGFEAVYALPKTRWSLASGGRRIAYQDRALEDGPIRQLVLNDGRRLRIDARGAVLAAVPESADPRPIDVELRIGLRRQCLRFGGKGRLSPGRQLVATDAAAPGACPP